MFPKRKNVVHSTKEIQNNKDTTYKWDIVWINVLILGSLHAGAIYGYIQRWHAMLPTLIYTKSLTVLATLGVTCGAHRLWSHRTYEANALCQIILAILMTLTYQNSIFIWSRDHRLHHKCSETDGDPHNAKRGFFFSHVGWLVVRKHPDVIESGKSIDMSDLKQNSIVMFQHKYYYILVILWAFLIPVYLPVYLWGESLRISFYCSLVRLVTQLNTTWCINSLAHLYGNKPYNKNIGPTENSLMKLCAFGEGFHNYHHTYPSDYKTSEFGPDIRNGSSLIIDMFAKFGWVTDRKTIAPSIIINRMDKTGDGTQEIYNKSRIWTHIRSFFFLFIYLIIL